jgi:hypothetical protein
MQRINVDVKNETEKPMSTVAIVVATSLLIYGVCRLCLFFSRPKLMKFFLIGAGLSQMWFPYVAVQWIDTLPVDPLYFFTPLAICSLMQVYAIFRLAKSNELTVYNRYDRPPQ